MSSEKQELSSENRFAGKEHQTLKRELRTTETRRRSSYQWKEASNVERTVNIKQLATRISEQRFARRVRTPLGREKNSQNQKMSHGQRVGNIEQYAAGSEKRTAI